MGLSLGLSNCLVTRTKLSDPVQRTTAATVLDKISETFLHLLQFDFDATQGQQVNLDQRVGYYLSVISYVHRTLTGSNSPKSRFTNSDAEGTTNDKMLQTLLLNRFKLKGGLDAILDIVDTLGEELLRLETDAPSS